MKKSLRIVIYTPEGKEYEHECEFVQVHTSDTYLGILPEHAPLISDVQISKLLVRIDGVDNVFAVGDGMLYIKNNEVKLIVSSLESADEIDIERALAAKQRAEDRLAGKLVDAENLDVKRAKAALARALVRIDISKK